MGPGTVTHPAAMHVKLKQSAGVLDFLSVEELPVAELHFPFPL